MDRLTAMQMFVRVVETGSFSAVAKEMNSTQPTISKNIAELESWLGAKLLNRSTRSLRLTETGTDYYERCVAILSDVEDAEQMVGQLQTQPRGTVRVSTVVAFGRLHLVPRMPAFFKRYPQITVDVRLSDRVVDLVEEGVDVAIRMGELADSSLIAKKLCTSPFVTVATPDYFKANGIPRHPRDLRDHNYLVYSEAGVRSETRFKDQDEPFYVKVEGNLTTNNTEALRAALLSGIGIARTPRWLVGDAIDDGRLVPVLEPFQPDPHAIHAVYPPGRHLPSKVRSFIDFIGEEFKDCSFIGGC